MHADSPTQNPKTWTPDQQIESAVVGKHLLTSQEAHLEELVLLNVLEGVPRLGSCEKAHQGGEGGQAAALEDRQRPQAVTARLHSHVLTPQWGEPSRRGLHATPSVLY